MPQRKRAAKDNVTFRQVHRALRLGKNSISRRIALMRRGSELVENAEQAGIMTSYFLDVVDSLLRRMKRRMKKKTVRGKKKIKRKGPQVDLTRDSRWFAQGD